MGTGCWQDLRKQLHGFLLTAQGFSEVLVAEVGLGESLVAGSSLDIVFREHGQILLQAKVV